MQIVLLTAGKSSDKILGQATQVYQKRLGNYVKFSIEELPDIKAIKSLSKEMLKEKEAELFMQYLLPTDYVILLDENGKESNSPEFAGRLQKMMLRGAKRSVFVIGGPYGFSAQMYERADETLSLSKMTFTHHMIRLFFIEQLYRAFTILKNEPYHH